jgi:hypothetical protein
VSFTPNGASATRSPGLVAVCGDIMMLRVSAANNIYVGENCQIEVL